MTQTAHAQDGGFSVGVGGVVGVKPKYEGSDEYEAFGAPIVLPKFGGMGLGGRVKVRGVDDVRFKVLDMGGFEVGPLAGYAFGREEDDGDLLLGLGDVDDGLILGAYAAYSNGPFLLDVSYHHIATGDDDGYLIRFGGGLKSEIRRGFTATLRGGATFADDNYMDSYFGITAAQSARSVAGLAVYEADSGIKDVHVELGAVYDITDRWTLKASGKYAHLLGDAGDSPIVESEDQFSAMFGASYRFDLGR
ncbi:MAG: MipA/OmpV family protein [Alphaproteobacteria bacterium]|nr:MipA/OmpV family protein [Alphaproteobacteria bacterium]